MVTSWKHEGVLEGGVVGEWTTALGTRVKVHLRLGVGGIIAAARWQVQGRPWLELAEPFRESLEALCSSAPGVSLRTMLRIDAHQLLQGVPEDHRRTEVGRVCTRALRRALECLTAPP